MPQDIESRDEDGKKQYLVVAVDTVSDRTISFDLIDSRDSDAIKGFLKQLEGGGRTHALWGWSFSTIAQKSS
ncbi:MAG: hypothetical protein U9R15_05735 [Chloroflexota bacterium]|nr:hypothetical protein [Chloroflexota bacterium]